jgi:predicted PurR-regulated permease PerM
VLDVMTSPLQPSTHGAARAPLAIAPAWQLVLAVVLLLLLWSLRYVALLCFAAIIAAAFLRGAAGPVARYTRWPARVAIVVVIVVLAALLVGITSMMGRPLLLQLQELRNTVPRAWASVELWLHGQPFGAQILSWTSDAAELKVPWARVALAATAATGALADGLLVLLLGIYLAFDPALYRHGFLRLVPPLHRSRIGAALAASGGALQRWLLGQGLTMLIVGTTVGVGLALLGMPVAAAMGFIAGLLEFVPFFGAIASLLLGTLLAFAQGPQQALYVAIFFLVIQQLEGNVVIPLVQRWAAHLPPVLSLLAVVVFGTLFGVEGIILGTPLMVVLMVLIEKLYVQGHLGEAAARAAPAAAAPAPVAASAPRIGASP